MIEPISEQLDNSINELIELKNKPGADKFLINSKLRLLIKSIKLNESINLNIKLKRKSTKIKLSNQPRFQSIKKNKKRQNKHQKRDLSK